MEIKAVSNPTSSPFFIVGCGRSGTTLLKSILSAHPKVFVAPETFYFKSVKKKIKEYGGSPWKAADLWWLHDAGINSKTLQQFAEIRMAQGHSHDAIVFGSIMDFHAAQHPDCLIGEKTPSHVKYVDEIRAIYPAAKFIHLYRDPRAVFSSYKKIEVGSRFLADVMAEWKTAANVMYENSDHENYFSLQYEQLVESPVDTLKQICDFLALEWTDAVLQFHSRADPGFAPEQKHHKNTRKPLFKSSVDSWRRDLSPTEIALIEWSVGADMEILNYERTALKNPTAPKVLMMASAIAGHLHRVFIRYPRQRLKAYMANRRLKKRGA